MIDWAAASSEILINPRLAENETRDVRSGIAVLIARGEAPDGHLWIATSGSESRPKWVALSRQAVLASAAASNAYLKSDDRDRWLLALPEFHVGGLGIRARAFLSGASVAPLDERWEAARFVETATRAEATLASLVPTQVHDLVAAGFVSPPALRAILVGGAALGAELYAKARLAGWNLLPTYGASECASQIATAPLESLESSAMPRLRLLSHLEARLDDGRLAFRGQSVFAGYASTDGTRWRFDDPKQNGWFVSEDLGELDGRLLTPRGRASDYFKIGGEGTSLARLQSIWERVGGNGVMLAVPDERLGQVVHLVCENEVDQGALDRFQKSVLPFERVRRVHANFAIARSELGKPLRGQILKSLPKT